MCADSRSHIFFHIISCLNRYSSARHSRISQCQYSTGTYSQNPINTSNTNTQPIAIQKAILVKRPASCEAACAAA